MMKVNVGLIILKSYHSVAGAPEQSEPHRSKPLSYRRGGRQRPLIAAADGGNYGVLCFATEGPHFYRGRTLKLTFIVTLLTVA